MNIGSKPSRLKGLLRRSSLAFTPKRKAICIGVSSDLAFAACITFLNFSQFHKEGDFDYLLYSDKNLDSLIAPLSKAGLDVQAIIYRPRIPWQKLWGSKSIAYFSPMVLSKFEALPLLAKYDQVVWLDYDVVIQRTFHELGELTSPVSFMEGSKLGESFIDISNFPSKIINADGVSAELMVFNKNLDSPLEIYESLHEQYSKHFANLRLPEQALFGLVFHELGVRKTILERRRFSPRSLDNRLEELPFMLHGSHSGKFWDGGQFDAGWELYNQKWLDLGGRSFSKQMHARAKALRKIRYVIARLMLAFGHRWEKT